MAKLMPGSSPEALEADMRAADKARRNYCAHYTGQVYGAAENYDLTLCTSKLGVDKSVSLVLAAVDHL